MAGLTQNKLKEKFTYNPETGSFTNNKTGKEVGSVSFQGYKVVYFDKKIHRFNRLAVLYMTGSWPKEQVDHINRDRLDDRWENLREVTAQENAQNRGKNKSKGLPRGVFTRNNRFRVKVKHNHVNYHGGYYSSVEEASIAAENLRVLLFGPYGR